MAITGAFPYDLNNLLGGAARSLFAPIAAAVPAKPSDIFQQVFPYNPIGCAWVTADVAVAGTGITVNSGASLPASGFPYSVFVPSQAGPITVSANAGNTLTVTGVTDIIPAGSPVHTLNGWRDFGATSDAFTYGRNLTAQGYQIQQATADVFEEVTETQRTAAVPMAEIRPETLQIVEEGTPGTVVESGTTTYDSVAYGTIHDLTQFRIAFVSRRSKQSGIVTETAGARTRGRYVVGLGYRGQISADNVQIQQGKGNLASAAVTFRFFPETTGSFVEGQEFGTWFLERARTI